ncbi:hydrogenase expression/formation protein HypE [Solemya velum gill symbiont]|uniref:Hydrogenase expression/formation protein HypE n=1 Tax=Solemya velum gill symbiont TaxID=2340 RepID=A0A0B0H8M4_SOVGS|nr:hydrogenase expression/formation protein HypE [Solemya velum gill symbiont]KHF24219.1 hydrogenase expression/formation protein HypE [Solemya velum gill symbiont]OOY36046.1 hydrogenase expression/formation protein HypE [Solemya velum gill symbiont]OOY36729.1 hydrogenase expression/formation protein HypE [Solemya velum gill symbiont]OOY48821.1 hydrogenase expression/formation protein HypE [Solemya velum gill symbiont]OOY49830.1 hydrogenase expression/formation protein HypE [Solemya velum gill
MQDTHISLAHGNGGRYMRELIEELFAKYLANPDLDVEADAASITVENNELLFTTDGFTVQPLEFPGGNIGSLAVHGTTNDLAVSGATPKYLSLNAFIEEGTEVALLERIIKSMAEAAAEIDVKIVAGDTKVLRRGEGGGVYLATTGIGIRNGHLLSMKNIHDGDAILVSGPVGDHGIAVMLAREEFGLHGEILSDAASVLNLTRAAHEFPGLRFMRDPTRGGLATVCTELNRATGMGVRLIETDIPVRDPVHAVCDMLGYDPLYLACEGRVVAIINPESADTLLQTWRNIKGGEESAIIGHISTATRQVIIETEIGGERILEELEDDPLPRIC